MTELRPEQPLAGEELACLAALAGLMIPASAAQGMPGGDDPAIVATLQSAAGRDAPALKRILQTVLTATGGVPTSREQTSFAERVSVMRGEAPEDFAVVEAVIARAYYRDPRVLAALGVPPRPPFPMGYAIEETDWSLLDPVRARGNIWRSAEG